MGYDKLKYTERCFRTAGNWNASKRRKKMEMIVQIFDTEGWSLIFYYFYLLIEIISSKPNATLLA